MHTYDHCPLSSGRGSYAGKATRRVRCVAGRISRANVSSDLAEPWRYSTHSAAREPSRSTSKRRPGYSALAAGAAPSARVSPAQKNAEKTVVPKRSLRDRVKDAFTTYGPAVAQFAQLGLQAWWTFRHGSAG